MYLDGHGAIQRAVKEIAAAARQNAAEPPEAMANIAETIITELQRISCALEAIAMNTRPGLPK